MTERGSGECLFMREMLGCCSSQVYTHRYHSLHAHKHTHKHLTHITTDVPNQQLRLQAFQSVMLLMPDGNREALQTLLHFLKEVASNSAVNQVNENSSGLVSTTNVIHKGNHPRACSMRTMQKPHVVRIPCDM